MFLSSRTLVVHRPWLWNSLLWRNQMIRTSVEFHPDHTLEPLHAWTQWSGQFQLASIAKENLDVESLHEPEVPQTQIPIMEQVTGSESDTDRANRETRNGNAKKQYESAEK